jgi:hypothetical protein
LNPNWYVLDDNHDASFAMLKKLREEMEKPKAAEEKP